MFTNKIAIIIRNDLQDWQKLNVAAFLAGSVAIKFPDTHGRAFVTANESEYLPFFRQPIFIYAASDEIQIKRSFNRAKERALNIGIYTRPLFTTKNEEANLAEIAQYRDDEQDLAGIVIYGESKKVDKAVKDLKFHL